MPSVSKDETIELTVFVFVNLSKFRLPCTPVNWRMRLNPRWGFCFTKVWTIVACFKVRQLYSTTIRGTYSLLSDFMKVVIAFGEMIYPSFHEIPGKEHRHVVFVCAIQGLLEDLKPPILALR